MGIQEQGLYRFDKVYLESITDKLGNHFVLSADPQRVANLMVESDKPKNAVLDLAVNRFNAHFLAGFMNTGHSIFVIDHHSVNPGHSSFYESNPGFHLVDPYAGYSDSDLSTAGILWNIYRNKFEGNLPGGKENPWYKWYRDLAFLSTIADGTWIGGKELYEEVRKDYPELFIDVLATFNGQVISVPADYNTWREKPYLGRLHPLGRLANRLNHPYYYTGDRGSQVLASHLMNLKEPLSLAVLASEDSDNYLVRGLNVLASGMEEKLQELYGQFNRYAVKDFVPNAHYWNMEVDNNLVRAMAGDIADILSAQHKGASIIIKTKVTEGKSKFTVRNRAGYMLRVKKFLMQELEKEGIFGHAGNNSVSFEVNSSYEEIAENVIKEYFQEMWKEEVLQSVFGLGMRGDEKSIELRGDDVMVKELGFLKGKEYEKVLRPLLESLRRGEVCIASDFDVDGIAALIILLGAAKMEYL